MGEDEEEEEEEEEEEAFPFSFASFSLLWLSRGCLTAKARRAPLCFIEWRCFLEAC